MSFTPGQVVRLRHNPVKVGTLTDKNKLLGDRLHWLVQFPSGFEYVPEDQLEHAAEGSVLDPYDLLTKGILSSARDLRRVLTHARLSGRLADYLYSLETTRTDFYAYQFKPVLKLLSSVSEGILIADEVGLGKTIEAGLIWTELRTRFEYRRLFVLCPAVLRDKWRDELKDRFGVNAEMCDASDALDRFRDAARDTTSESFALIGSMQGLRPRGDADVASGASSPSQKLAQFLEEREGEPPLVDLLVIDEAHHMRNADTATARLGRLLRGTAGHVVLLTATPVNLRNEDLFSLMRLMDQDTFASVAEFQDILNANGPLVDARRRILEKGVSRSELRDLIERAQRHPILQGSQTLAAMLSDHFTDDDLQSHRVRADLAQQLDQANLLGQVINRTRKREVHEHRIERKAVAHSAVLSAVEAEFYQGVTEIVRDYCRGRNASEGFLLTMPQRQMASSIPAAFRHWKGQVSTGQVRPEEDLEDEEEDIERGETPGTATPMGALVEALVRRVHAFGPYASLKLGDSKYRRLIEALRSHLKETPDAKIVLFSSFRATLAYLDERLREDGVPTLLITGDTQNKHAVIDECRNHMGGMVLLSSEVGSEGVDLQFSRVIVNYDLPWNPMRVEQRIGRLDRIGQSAKAVSIWNLFCAGTIDERIYERLYRRIGIFEQALGGLEPILGDAIRDLTWELLRDTLTSEQEAGVIERKLQAIEVRRKIEEDLESNAAQFFALGDYLFEQVTAARDLGRRISDLDLLNYVVEFLHLRHPECRMEKVPGDALRLDLRLSPDARIGLEKFMKENRIATPTRLTSYSVSLIPCRLRNVAVDAEGRDTETINQFHPLVRYAREVLRKEEANLRLAVAAEVDADAVSGFVAPGRYVFAVDRWSVQGVQLLEKLAYTAVNAETGAGLDDDIAERLVNAAAVAGGDWLSAAADVGHADAGKSAGDDCLTSLEARFEKYERTARLQNEDRADALIRTLDRQVEGQVARIQATIDAQRARGQTGLVAANQARIERLRERAEMRRMRYREGVTLMTERVLFLMGYIQVRP